MNAAPAMSNLFTAAEVGAILRERGWLSDVASPEIDGWLEEAAVLLGPHAGDRVVLEDLLSLIFLSNAKALLESPGNQAVVTRAGAREVIRELARRVLDGPDIDPERFKDIVDELKSALRFRGRELFYPIRLALAGCAGEGELDRVILLLDRSAKLPFRAQVKGTRERMIEFCAALG